VIDVEQVRTAHPIAAAVEQRGVTLRPVGRRFVGRCPFHPDREPSFTVYPETQSYFCFGCGAGGDVIDFVARHERLDFRAAVARLGACDLA
jgi:DNA primase